MPFFSNEVKLTPTMPSQAQNWLSRKMAMKEPSILMYFFFFQLNCCRFGTNRIPPTFSFTVEMKYRTRWEELFLIHIFMISFSFYYLFIFKVFYLLTPLSPSSKAACPLKIVECRVIFSRDSFRNCKLDCPTWIFVSFLLVLIFSYFNDSTLSFEPTISTNSYLDFSLLYIIEKWWVLFTYFCRLKE